MGLSCNPISSLRGNPFCTPAVCGVLSSVPCSHLLQAGLHVESCRKKLLQDAQGDQGAIPGQVLSGKVPLYEPHYSHRDCCESWKENITYVFITSMRLIKAEEARQ